MQQRLFVVPLTLREANKIVRLWHRHHYESRGHRFSIGCVDQSGLLHGVAIVGRPVARGSGLPNDVLEVSRVATDGTANACSILYGAAARTAQAMGYLKIQTYTLPHEGGASLRAAGWTEEATTAGGQWKHTDGKERRTDQPTEQKTRWSRQLRQTPRPIHFPNTPDEIQLTLFES
jgi:hypothetical protein